MKVNFWIARDKNDDLWGYLEKPNKTNFDTWTGNGCGLINIPNDLFPNIEWEDKEPVKAEIVINK